jgi:hypothetical protein
MSDKLAPPSPDKPISKEEFDRRDKELTEALDKLEKEALPPKPAPAPIGSMF